MTLASSRVYVTIRRLLRTSVGKRFSRFIPVAVAALATSLTMNTVLVGLVHLTYGLAGVLAAMTGAGVSYVLSRWAWERKGRPDPLRETLPFWAVAMGAWLVLGVANHFGSVWATSLHLTHWRHVAFADSVYFLTNCVTFLSRFVIFHYVLFADRQPMKPGLVPQASIQGAAQETAALQEAEVPASGRRPSGALGGTASGPLAARGSGARVLGPSAWAEGVADWSPGRRGEADTGPLPEEGTRR